MTAHNNCTIRPPLLLKVSEVAALLRVSRQYVYALISDGAIKASGDHGAMRVSTRSLCDAYGLNLDDVAEYLAKKEG